MATHRSVHVDLDGAWARDTLPEAHYHACREWGPPLRYSTTRRLIDQFAEHTAGEATPFTLFGSGDFHHLTAVWLRRLREPYTLVCFDNHPDWDIRPPRWGCGTWVSRALESPLLQQATVWGCGNFELEWPNKLFRNRRGLKSGRLHVRPWAERLKPKTRGQWPSLAPETWRAEFSAFARELAGRQVYVTVDLDSLRAEDATTNWESGLFTSDDIAWALGEITRHTALVGGDVCGAYSAQQYARFIQRIEARLDHPPLPPVDPVEAAARNLRALRIIWPALTAGKVGD